MTVALAPIGLRLLEGSEPRDQPGFFGARKASAGRSTGAMRCEATLPNGDILLHNSFHPVLDLAGAPLTLDADSKEWSNSTRGTGSGTSHRRNWKPGPDSQAGVADPWISPLRIPFVQHSSLSPNDKANQGGLQRPFFAEASGGR
ncbi:predicted protein [Uncinocarpus reesii 1704]|uniref:Uncharacterized protein n=1 Tax=Uncinocarpus reesii (strain UAMH 1704) TaxID=336963 RepID=C4JF28_UNCRE|nr:uncharacterized protein UREG_00929 [Uncinocarpus reesii 1704]EEP76081.1 predicted protein [Uncinocarpus reesii 1704]